MLTASSGDLDTLPSPDIPILVGPGTIASVSPGYPKDTKQEWPSSWLETYNFLELPDPGSTPRAFEGYLATFMRSDADAPRQYQPVGPFKHGVDWFGDGSLWFVDAPGVSPTVSKRSEKVFPDVMPAL